ncbi:MAG: ABC transporter ATP-binding protein, partial [Mycobacteriales bacterium]
LEVNEYEIVGLIGPNGAGKTTAFNCITGFYKPNTGTVTYRGQDVTKAPPHVKASIGFGRTFQNVGMVKSATALENLKTAQHAKAGYGAGSGLVGAGSALRAEKQLTAKADAILDLLGLADIRNKRVGGQSYGTLKLLELGCALATDPDVLLLDEPTSGMGPDESDELGERLLVLRKEFGLTILVIEHHVPLVLRVCDHVYVLNFGRLLAEGKPTFIQTHPEVVAAYLGGEDPEALAATQETEEDAALDAQLEGAVSEPVATPVRRGRKAAEVVEPESFEEDVVAPVAPADEALTAEGLAEDEVPADDSPTVALRTSRRRKARTAAEERAERTAAASRPRRTRKKTR